jgi:AraC-like DNA-binding protein
MQQQFQLPKAQAQLATYGDLLGTIDTSGFFVAEKVYSPNLTIPLHSHDTIVMSLPLFGSFVESNSLSQYLCNKFGLSINPAGEDHGSRFCDHESRCLILEVKPSNLTLNHRTLKALDRPLYIEDSALSGLALRVYRELKSADEASSLAVEGLLLEMIALTIRDGPRVGTGRPPKWLVYSRDYLHAHFNERISLQQLGDVAAVHSSHLARMFRRHYRCSIGEYVRRLRLDHSARELSQPEERSLAEIAANAGFYDQSHFVNAFKRHTGMTPSEFRRAQARSAFPTMLQTSKTRLKTER